MGEWRYSSIILDLSFIPWLLYSLGNSSQHPVGRMGGPHSWMLWRTEKSFLYQESNLGHPGHNPSQYQMKYPDSNIHSYINKINITVCT
jgi:hypothetical protein